MKLKRTEFLILKQQSSRKQRQRKRNQFKILPCVSSWRDESEAFRLAGPTISRLESSLVKSPKGRFFLIDIRIECQGRERQRAQGERWRHRKWSWPWYRWKQRCVDPNFDISYLRRCGEYNFSSRLAARNAIPADERTSFSRALITLLHRF